MFRHRVARTLGLSLLALAVITLGQTANARQNDPFSPTVPEVKESLYASTGAVLTQYELDEKQAILTVRSTVTLPRGVQYAWPSPDHRVLYVSWSAGTNDRA